MFTNRVSLRPRPSFGAYPTNLRELRDGFQDGQSFCGRNAFGESVSARLRLNFPRCPNAINFMVDVFQQYRLDGDEDYQIERQDELPRFQSAGHAPPRHTHSGIWMREMPSYLRIHHGKGHDQAHPACLCVISWSLELCSVSPHSYSRLHSSDCMLPLPLLTLPRLSITQGVFTSSRSVKQIQARLKLLTRVTPDDLTVLLLDGDRGDTSNAQPTRHS
ncbi:hypothetical protein F5148DRAFT_1152940 [Russula earlei]|uniref:Uncharacterized protein n=1 Tax=Russula earlei TaxID=71964 RepID=A0ACC0TUU1_9AGAM|nr:hypothetical protein F5148DRAFT_1152940 [Russula earlei]